ncbi:MAG: hypothetical protein ACKVWV_17750 [Planctomycetota bacterium]
MIRLEFGGWFQCRLATDPDPYDEPRGVSGYVHAYADEPDLDRVVHWQRAPFSRVEAPEVGVTVRRVERDGLEHPQHPLLGADVALLDQPKFEGRNGVIADDGDEPVYPFHVRLKSQSGVILERRVVPSDAQFPYAELFASGVEGGPDVAREIAEATRIPDLKALWQRRLTALRTRALSSAGAARVGLHERIAILSRWLNATRSPAGFFVVRMVYDYSLRSKPLISGWTQEIGPPPSSNVEWRIKFWLGGWDADALCGYCKGLMELPTQGPVDGESVGFREDDRDELMRRGMR